MPSKEPLPSGELPAAKSVSRAEPSPLERGLVLFISALGGFLVTFMTSAVNLALPVIGEEFQTSAVTLSWVSLAYMLVSGACLLPMGRLGDLYGRVRVFNWGMVAFCALALASALAPSIEVLLALRALHGVSLAVGSATAFALVVSAYPAESRGRALGLTVASVYAGMSLGPVVGGLIVHHLGWRMLFVVTGVLGLVNLAVGFGRLRGIEWREPKTAPFDVAGSLVYAAGFVSLLLGFSFLPEIAGVALVAAGVGALVVFLRVEKRASDPLLQTSLLRGNPVFTFSNLAALLQYGATYAMIFLLSLYLQYNRGLDAQSAGLVLVAGNVVQVICAPLAGRLADRVSTRHLASVGLGISVLGLVGFSFLGADTAYWYIMAMLCLVGAGVAIFAAPNTHTIVSSVDGRWVGMASATLAAMRQAGMNMSQAVATLVLAVEVGRGAIQSADHSQLLVSIRLSFLIFVALSVLGVAASLVGPRRTVDQTLVGD